jgi:hypothetical protein
MRRYYSLVRSTANWQRTGEAIPLDPLTRLARMQSSERQWFSEQPFADNADTYLATEVSDR